MGSLLSSMFSTEGFMPHGHCYLWTPSLVWTMVATDTLIFIISTEIFLQIQMEMRKNITNHGLVEEPITISST